MTTQDKINKIVETIEAGHTVFFTNYLHKYKVDKKTLDRFAKSGTDLFKADGAHLLMAQGKTYVSMIGCQITYV